MRLHPGPRLLAEISRTLPPLAGCPFQVLRTVTTVKTRLCENLAQHTRGCNDIGTADLQ
jgi:hypothetical protein